MSGTLIVVAPASMAAWKHLAQKVPVAAGGVLRRELDVVDVCLARRQALTAISSTSSGSLRSLCFMWIGEVAINV